MNASNPIFRAGDLVEVKTSTEIMESLDDDGAVDFLPFMPEMLQHCGERLHLGVRALTVCFSGAGSPREFRGNDVVTLAGVRCSGSAHGGCQKACTIFWRESWLRKVGDPTSAPNLRAEEDEHLRARLKTSTGAGTYFCQASELAKATDPLSRWGRVERYWRGFVVGNFHGMRIPISIGTWLIWKVRALIFGVYARGNRKSTPTEGLKLRPGEWVKVKSMEEIRATLDPRGRNQGLYFSPDMRLLCGRTCRVRGRLDKIIVDGTGKERRLRNTVCLEGSTCGCAYLGFGMDGCARSELSYWREVWLERAEGP